MALTQSVIGTGRSYSLGPIKQQRVAIAVLAADTSGTITFDSLSSVESVLVSGLIVTAITITGNSAAITFTAPGANFVGVAEAHGV